MAPPILRVLQMFCMSKDLRWRYFIERTSGRRYKAARYFILSLVGVNTILPESFLDRPEHTTNLENSSYNNGRTVDKNDVMLMTFEPNDPRLRSSECLKNAAGLAVDSTSAVLSQTLYAVIDIEQKYVEVLNLLAVLMEKQLQVLGLQAEEEKVADLILKTRHEVNNLYKRKQDLALLFASVKKLADATAEVAFATGAGYASTSICERLHSAENEVQKVQAVSEDAEKKMQSVKIKSIEVISKYEQGKQEQNRCTDM